MDHYGMLNMAAVEMEVLFN